MERMINTEVQILLLPIAIWIILLGLLIDATDYKLLDDNFLG